MGTPFGLDASESSDSRIEKCASLKQQRHFISAPEAIHGTAAIATGAFMSYAWAYVSDFSIKATTWRNLAKVSTGAVKDLQVCNSALPMLQDKCNAYFIWIWGTYCWIVWLCSIVIHSFA